MTARILGWYGLIALFASTAGLRAQPSAEDFTELSLEELGQIQITSIARKQGSLFDASAAAYVLSGDDIHRLGATDLASALRAVPGLQVGKTDAANYAISARGFNDFTSSKLLVLMDGRSLYSQTFSGAYWSYHELFLDDVDRIEVIRGPGATLWGANAMNGVINIVTKSAFSSIGSLASLSRGDHLEGIAAVREGWQFNRTTAARVYARFRENDGNGAVSGPGANGSQNFLLGSRLDWKRDDRRTLTLIGEYRTQRLDSLTDIPSYSPPYATTVSETRTRAGGHLLARWRQPVPTNGELTVQASYEQLEGSEVSYGERHGIADIDLQLTLRPLPRHEILAGANVRRDHDRLRSSSFLVYEPANATTTFAGAFVQDDVTLKPDRLQFTVGAKIERNSFTGWEAQPGVRLLWHPTRNQSLWMAASRAARTPSRSERTIDWLAAIGAPAPGQPLPLAIEAKGSDAFDSEHLSATELGYRFKPNARLSFDTALFVNSYHDIRGLSATVTPFAPLPLPHTVLALEATNNIAGKTYGGEFLVRWRARDALTLEASTSTVRYDLGEQQPSLVLPDSTLPALVGTTPHWESKLRATWDFHDAWSFDVFARRVDALPAQGIPAYTGLDLHLNWRPRHALELELVAQDVLDPHHPEMLPNFLGGKLSETPRRYYLRATFRR